MSLPDTNTASMNSCASCKQGKRKCNRARPTCSTCTRVGRSCHYEEDSYISPQSIGSYHSQSLHSRSDDGANQSQSPSIQGLSPNMLFTFPVISVDPFRHDALRQPTVYVAVSTEAAKILGTVDKIHGMVTKYFRTIWQRMPIISQARFFSRLPTIFLNPRADYIVLTLTIHLLIQCPSPGEQSMQSSLYVTIKSFINLLESTSFLSLEVVQARLLVTFYEMGHGIHPGASISIASCARSARLLGLNKKAFQVLRKADSDEERIVKEEEKRVWWAVVNLDRFINLCNGDSFFTTEDQLSTDSLPIDDKKWAQNIVPETNYLALSTPSDVTVGHYARECQVSHLVGRVLKHVFEPASDLEFHAQEAMQLERTLNAFMPLLVEEHTKYGLYCAALGMCSNALFILYDTALCSPHNPSDSKPSLLNSIECNSTTIADFARHLFGDINAVDFHTVSPFIPHALYQAAIVQYRVWKQGGEMKFRNGFESLKDILGHFDRRWLIGGKYLEALEGIMEDFPLTTVPLQGVCVSATAPSG